MDWEDRLKKIANSTIVWSIGEGYLNYLRQPLQFHTLDKIILLYYNYGLDNLQQFSILYPAPTNDIIIPLSVDALYHFIDNQAKKKTLMVFTKDTNFRTTYLSLKVGCEDLHSFFPLGLPRRDGSIRLLGRYGHISKLKSSDVRLIHCSSLGIFPEKTVTQEIALALIDCSSFTNLQEIREIRSWLSENGITKVCFFLTDPYSQTLQQLIHEKKPLWAFDKAAIEYGLSKDMLLAKSHPKHFDNPFSISLFRIAKLAKGASYKVEVIHDDLLSQSLTEGREIYSKTKQYCQANNKPELERLNRFFLFIIYSFERLLCPLSYLEDEAGKHFFFESINEKILKLKKLKDDLNKKDPSFMAYWSSSIVLLDRIYSYLQKNKKTPKVAFIEDTVKSCIMRKKTALIVCCNESNKKATVKYISDMFKKNEEELSKEGINVTSIQKIKTGTTYDICVLFGQIPNNYRFLLRLSLSDQVILPIYDSEKSYLEYQLKMQDEQISNIVEYANRLNPINKALEENEFKLGQTETQELYGAQQVRGDEQVKIKPDKLSLSELFSQIKEHPLNTEELPSEYDVEEFETEEVYATDTVDAIKIIFDDESYLYSIPSKFLPVVNETKYSLDHKRATSLKKGDILLLVNKSTKKTITKVIFEKLDKNEEIQKMKIYSQLWVLALNKGMSEHNLTDASLLQKLQESGSQIQTSLTIAQWRDGSTLCPLDANNILYIGKLFNNQVLINHFKEIYNSVNRLRVLHRIIIRKLSKALLNKGLSAKFEGNNEAIDSEFNLYLEDFVNYIDLVRVDNIIMEKDIPINRLGELYKI